MNNDKHPMATLHRRTLIGALLCAGLPALHAQELTDLAKIRASGVLKVAVYKDNAPFSGGAANDIQGLDVSLASALARQLDLKLSLLPFDAGENMNDDLRNMVWRGHYLGYGPADVMLQVPVDRYLMQKNRQVLILAPYMRQQLVVAHDTRRIADVASADDLKGQPLSAERGAAAASVLMGSNGGMLRTQVGIEPTGEAAVRAVVEGRSAAAYVLRAQAEAVLARSELPPGRIRLTPLTLPGMPANGWPVGMAVKTEHKDLGQALEAALNRLRDSGELLAIFRQHGLTLTAP